MQNKIIFLETNKTTLLSSPEQYDLMSLLKVKIYTNEYLCMLYMFLSNLSSNVSVNRNTSDNIYDPTKYLCMYEMTSLNAVQIHRNNNKENCINF